MGRKCRDQLLLCFRGRARDSIEHRFSEVRVICRVGAGLQQSVDHVHVSGGRRCVQGTLARLRRRIGTGAVGQKNVDDICKPQTRHVDERRIAELVHRVDIGAPRCQEAHAIRESFDREEVQNRLVVDPARV